MKNAGETIEGTKKIETTVNTEISMPRKESLPNSIYEQLDSHGKVKSRASYDENGRQFSRQDFEGKPHYIKEAHEKVNPHEHNYSYNKFGQPNGKNANPLPSGYTNLPSIGRDKL